MKKSHLRLVTEPKSRNYENYLFIAFIFFTFLGIEFSPYFYAVAFASIVLGIYFERKNNE